MRHIRVHGQAKKHHHPILGLNGRLDTLQAAVVLAKLDIFDDEIAKRQAVAEQYLRGFEHCDQNLTLPSLGDGNISVYAQYTLLSEERDALAAVLKEGGVPSVSYYAVPLHLQPVFADLGHSRGDFPVTEYVSSRCLSLPMNPYLSEAAIAKVCETISC